MRKLLFSLVLLLSMPAFSQSLNDYRYVVVPSKYDFLKEDDKYHLNSLTKSFLQKYGFITFLGTDEIPDDLSNKRCTVLYATLIKDSGIFMTKVKLALKDCKENVVFETDFGSSREKDYNVAYNQALRAALKSFDKVPYQYNGKNDATAPAPVVPVAPETPQPVTPQASTPFADTNPELFFFAQPITNGFQIVDSEPRVIMRLFNTSQKNVFIGVKEDTRGVVILKNNQWVFEYYENSKLVSEPLKLRF